MKNASIKLKSFKNLESQALLRQTDVVVWRDFRPKNTFQTEFGKNLLL